MYRIIAYHGKGNNSQVKNDLRLLWNSVKELTSHGKVQHIYCFQVVHDNNSTFRLRRKGRGGGELNLLLILQYGDNVAAKLALSTRSTRQASQTYNYVDYWFYVRENN